MSKIYAIILALYVLLSAGVAEGTLVTTIYGPFEVTFYGSSDNDALFTGAQNWTQQQMDDVGSAIAAWTSGIENTPGRNIKIDLFWNEMDSYGHNVLGGSANYRAADGQTQYNLAEYIWREGDDPGTTSYGFDAVILLDTTAAGLSWNFGQTAPDLQEIDFRSVITHELGHSLGWSSTYDPDYDDWGWFVGGYEGITEWDKNLVDSEGSKPVNGGSGNFNAEDNPVYWDGENAVAYYGGPVPIYAPDPYRQGSSLSHLDYPAFAGLLMSPYAQPGLATRSVSPLEWAMMMDMGWDISENAVPEPATAAILIIGTGCLLLHPRKAGNRA